MVKLLVTMVTFSQIILVIKLVRNCDDATITFKCWEDIPNENKAKMYAAALVRLINIVYY